MVAFPVVCTSLYPLTEPPFMVIEEPMSVVPGLFGPERRIKLLKSSWPTDFTLRNERHGTRKRILTVSLILIIMIFRSSGPVGK